MYKNLDELIIDLTKNSKKREAFKKYHLRMQGYILSNKDFTHKPTDKMMFDERREDVDNLTDSIYALYLVKSIEEYKKNSMTNCKFRLFKKGKQYIIANTYKHKGKRKLYKTFHFMPNGLPIGRRMREKKYRDKYSLRGFKLIDEGRFYQVFDAYHGSKISYVGRRYRFRIKYRGYGKETTKNYWIEMLRFRKITNS